MDIKILNAQDADFSENLNQLIAYGAANLDEVRKIVSSILLDVKQHGDKALLEYTSKFDKLNVENLQDLRVNQDELAQAWDNLDHKMQNALATAHANVVEYGQKQKMQDWQYQREDGSILGQKVTPLDSAGIYVPGGKASYPSSVIMNAACAQVAGVKRIVMTVPAPNNQLNPLVLAAAHLCGVNEVWKIGGAQAIAALAFGTETIAAVDKITGPGNAFVAEAKRQVFGRVGIDMVAGPSEVVIIADENAKADWICADMFAQAEHDEMAQSILLTDSQDLINKVQNSLEIMLAEQPRADIIRKSLQSRAALILCKNLSQCVEIANLIAPEHLELACDNAKNLMSEIRHAGAVFVGEHSNEVFGDYCAGTNHVLPTSRTARFASGLGVYDFQKRTAVLELSKQAAAKLSPVADLLAQGEGLFAHALSARFRS